MTTEGTMEEGADAEGSNGGDSNNNSNSTWDKVDECDATQTTRLSSTSPSAVVGSGISTARTATTSSGAGAGAGAGAGTDTASAANAAADHKRNSVVPLYLLRNPVRSLANSLGLVVASKHAGSPADASSFEALEGALDAYRLLETRVAPGLLGRGDTREARAACLLRRFFLTRGGNRCNVGGGTNRLPSGGQQQLLQQLLSWKKLASKVGSRPAALEDLYGRIAHYLQPPCVEPPNNYKNRPTMKIGAARQPQQQCQRQATTSSSSPRRVLRRGVGALLPMDGGQTGGGRGGNGGTADTNSCAAAALADREVWMALSIRLQCPSQSIKRAQELWRRLVMHASHLSNVNERRGYLYDLQRYRSAYQAACLHRILVVEPGAGGSSTRARVESGSGSNSHVTTGLKLHDFVLPNHFTNLELQQMSRQVAQVVASLETPSLSSSSSATAKMTAPAVFSTVDLAKDPTATKTTTMNATSETTTRAAKSSSTARRSAAARVGPTSSNVQKDKENHRSRGWGGLRDTVDDISDIDDDADASSTRRGCRGKRQRTNHGQGRRRPADGAEADRPETALAAPPPSLSAAAPNAMDWIDEWYRQLWSVTLRIDPNDENAVEQAADRVLTRRRRRSPRPNDNGKDGGAGDDELSSPVPSLSSWSSSSPYESAQSHITQASEFSTPQQGSGGTLTGDALKS